MLDKAIMCCRSYAGDTNYIIREYIQICDETDKILSDNAWWYSAERNPNMDRIYNKIIDIYDTVTRLLPKSTFAIGEKENWYKK